VRHRAHLFSCFSSSSNRAGGGGTIGAETAVRATPDSYTAIITSGSYATNAAVSKLPYDPGNDILPMRLIGDTAFTKLPDMKERLASEGFDIDDSPPEVFQAVPTASARDTTNFLWRGR
jgi:hypothetical protein